MDPSTLIVTSLALGFSAGLAATAEQAIKDAYHGLKTVIVEKYGKLRSSIEYLEANPESEARLAVVADEFRSSGAADDLDVSEKTAKLVQAVQDHSGNIELRNKAEIVLGSITAINVRLRNMTASAHDEARLQVGPIQASGDVEISNWKALTQKDPKP